MIQELDLQIVGMGGTGAFGNDVSQLAGLLRNGEVKPQWIEMQKSDESARVPVFKAAVRGVLKQYISPRQARRLDSFSALAIYAACSCLADAGVKDDGDKSRIGLVLGTGFGPVETTFAFFEDLFVDGDWAASPTKFSHSIQNAAATQISLLCGIADVSYTLNVFELSFLSGLPLVNDLLQRGIADYVLWGAVDEVSPAVAYCYHRLFGDIPATMTPLDFRRQTAIPGEGGAFFLIGRSGEDHPGCRGKIRGLACGEVQRGIPGEICSKPRVILGADGHRCTGQWYAKIMENIELHGVDVLAPAVTYGAFPSGSALALATGLGMNAYGWRDFALWQANPDGAWLWLQVENA
ncbi:MAG: hypothetical protein D6820_14340 [Lentisphaerae bacterium]|nr:MAG: hypothetical protein D6820_14340 [Lentisphaerota bacterium]